jgi:hypothetical protein
MGQSKSRFLGYVLAGLLGGILGGIIVLLATRALPRMMAGRMQQMMAMMKERGAVMPET